MLESSENSNDTPSMVHSPARTSSASWGIPLAGLAAVAVCVVASIMLIRMYIASRPLDIAPANAAMVRHIDDLLTMCQLPESSILRTVPVTRSDEGATWRFHAIDIGVPPTMSAQNVIDTIKEGMALQNVSVSERKGGSAPGVELHFAMLDREFAVVRIMGGAERHDLRPACDELANNVYNVLMNASNVVEVSKTSVEDRQDGPTQWRLYAYRLIGAPGMDPGNLRQLLATSLAHVRDEAPEVFFRPNRLLLEVLWRKRPIVRVEIKQVPSLSAFSKKHFSADPRLIYEESPLLFRSLFGFDPDISGFPLRFLASPSEKTESTLQETDVPAGGMRVAIIVDDGGYGGLASDAILTMDSSLTLSILPGTPFATETAQSARTRGFEILLHMPLESGNGQNAYPGELTTSMEASEMEERLKEALTQVPGAVGMNNHTGSKFTADEQAMKRLLDALKKHGMFFVDSRTTAETVAETVARDLGVPVARRSVFLDNETDPEYIRGQIAALVEAAKTDGHAIGICHFRSTTAAMLPEIMRLLKSQGISLVHVSELVQ